MATELESRLVELEETERELLEVGQRIMAAYGRRLQPFDLIAYAAIKRSLALIAGFVGHIREKNFICAASIIRLHLDTALRVAAGAFAKDAGALAKFVLDGGRLNKFRTADGKRMTDSELVERLAKGNPWITRVYRETSGYVHLSRKHISNAVRKEAEAESFQIALRKEDDAISDEDRIEASAAMLAITQLIVHCLECWRMSKDDPPPVE